MVYPLATDGRSYSYANSIKRALGLPKKLPTRIRDGRMHYVGQINGYGIFDYGQLPNKRRTHRLYCLVGDRYIPCGRMHQVKL